MAKKRYLIDSDDLSQAVEKWFDGVCVYDVPPSEAVSDFQSIIDSVPVVDAVEVVRCKDCIHSKLLGDTPLIKENPWKYYRSDCRICGCHDLIGDEFLLVEDEFFCAYGKRKETRDARDQRHLPS